MSADAAAPATTEAELAQAVAAIKAAGIEIERHAARQDAVHHQAMAEAAAIRRRWITLGKIVAVAGLIISALALYLSYADRRADEAERMVRWLETNGVKAELISIREYNQLPEILEPKE